MSGAAILDFSIIQFLLILATVFGGLAVGAGIIWEAKRGGHLWTWPTALVFVGVVIEAASTVTLFEVDEGISRTQRTQIVTLETRLADLLKQVSATRLTNEAVAKAFADDVRGKLSHLTVVRIPDEEAGNFASDLEVAFRRAGIVTEDVLATDPPHGHFTFETGLLIVYDEKTQGAQAKALAHALYDLQAALGREIGPIGPTISVPTVGDGTPIFQEVPRPALYVGLRPSPYWRSEK